MDIHEIFQWILDAGGLAGIGAVIVLVINAVSDAKGARRKLDEDALLAKAQIAKDAILAKAQVDRMQAETDDVIAKASDAMVTGMQKRVNALIARVEVSEHQKDELDLEIAELKKRVEVLEELLIKKDGDIEARNGRIAELEYKVKEQAIEINHLKEQVRVLELISGKTVT